MQKRILFALALLPALLIGQTVKMNLQTFATGLVKPVDIVGLPDGRLLVVEQRGTVKVVNADGSVAPTAFIDLQSIANDNSNERGLLGLALDPDFSSNGFFYVNYSRNSTGNTQISRFSLDPTDPNKGDPTSEVQILEIAQPFSNHNGGCLKFGPDGYLYIGMGDGGSQADPNQNGQNTNALLGKMLRIDVKQLPYTVPPDNPFANDPTKKGEIWAVGMRNPWRFSFDKLTGDLWIGDVGQNAHEEIDRAPAGVGGLNFGWRCREGFSPYNTTGNCPPDSTFTDPVFDWANPSVGCSVTGGFVYRGTGYPAWDGIYFCADYCSGRFWSIVKNMDGTYTGTQIADLADSQTTAFGEDASGRLYTTGHGVGRIYKLCSTFTVAAAGVNETCPGAADGSISLTVNDLQGNASYKWSNGATTPTASGLSAGTYSVTVSDGDQCTVKASATITATAVTVPVIFVTGNFFAIGSGFLPPFQWYLNGAPIPGANSATYVPTQGGVDYTVSAIDSLTGCAVLSPALPYTLSTGELPAGIRKVSVSPNPFTDELSIEVELASKQTVRLSLLDPSGHSVWEKKVRAGRVSERVDLGKVAAGAYFLKLETPGGSVVRRVVKD